MKKSIIQDDWSKCFLCGRNGNGDGLEVHHIFYGTSNRKHSDEDGLVVRLCGRRCHRLGEHSAHKDREVNSYLRKTAQKAWEANYGTRQAFRSRYGMSVLD